MIGPNSSSSSDGSTPLGVLPSPRPHGRPAGGSAPRGSVGGLSRTSRSLSRCLRPPRRSSRSPTASTPGCVSWSTWSRPAGRRWTPTCGRRWRRSVASSPRAASGLRPAFCHWGFVAAGGDPTDDRSIDAGAAFELLHAFALFHDDVMDGSATRRGTRTTHLSFADTHAAQGWSGEPRRFGEGVAILVGDLAFVYADQLMHGAPLRGVGDLDRAAHRAQRRPVPRHPGHGAGGAQPRHGRAHRPLQERQVHGRASPPPRRRAGRARPGRRPPALAVGLRPAPGRRLPAPRRRPRRLRRDDAHGQAGRRRPARGQADTADGDGHGPRRSPAGRGAGPRRAARPDRGGRRAHPGGPRRRRARWPSSSRSSTTSPSRRWSPSTWPTSRTTPARRSPRWRTTWPGGSCEPPRPLPAAALTP